MPMSIYKAKGIINKSIYECGFLKKVLYNYRPIELFNTRPGTKYLY